ncbi:MAG: arylsulfatase A-like enzyme [Myxococcota bacterium]|jgi:arylsulfatase A-like enzyme
MMLACADRAPLDVPAGHAPERASPRASTAVAFARLPAGLRLQAPPSCRPGGKGAPPAFGLAGPFEHHETRAKVDIYRSPLPVLSNLMPTKLKGTHSFGSGPPPGFEVHGPVQQLPFQRSGRAAGAYGFDRDYLYVGVSVGDPAPEAADFFVRYPRATDSERALNRGSFDGDDAEFALRSITVDTESMHGLYLPAPGRAAWTVTVPEAGVLTFRGTILPPAIADTRRSDGADVVLEVVAADGTHSVGSAALDVAAWSDHRFDLSAWAGQEVEVAFRAEPGESPTFDYVFIEGPTLYTPSADPRRVVLVFVDTLRPDHLGFYGYADAPTTPSLDRWAAGATVFEQARGVAPWTLPSARAALSGAQPEQWFEVPSIAERFAAEGFHTEAMVSNAFLSQPFDMHRGWTHFAYDHLQPAADLSRRAQAVLERNADRDVLLLVHFMEPHLPYEESWTYRWQFAGLRPSALESLTRHWLYDLPPDHPDLPAIREHVMDRYDGNIRVVDDQLLPLLTAAGPAATVALFSDHGEEFWDHGSFEHGHSFYDELLHVPLAIRSPGLPAGRVEAPVSLLDLAPTLLALEGLDSDVLHGASLVPLAWGDDGAEAQFTARPQAFGRPLYGPDGWGVVHDEHKWYGRGGQRFAHDLASDPTEQTDIVRELDEAAFPGAMAEALEREVVLAWRAKIFQRTTGGRVTLTFSHPGGIADVWAAYDPRGRTASASPEVGEDGVARVVVEAGAEAPAAVYIVPTAADPLDCRGLRVDIAGAGIRLTGTCRQPPLPLSPEKQTLLLVGDNRWGASVDLEWTPVPAGVAVSGFDAGVESQLRELGYVDD